MGILLWVVTGLGIAFVANWKMPPRNRNGTIITLVFASFGGLVGGIVNAGSSADSLATVTGVGLICAAAGACLALLAIQLLKSALHIEH